MASAGSIPPNNPLRPDPSSIGGVSKAPFVLLPDPPRLFAQRAERFDALAPGNDLAPYLRFLGQLTRVQARLAATLRVPDLVAAPGRLRARATTSTPLDRAALADDPGTLAGLDRLLDAAAAIPMPQAAAETLHDMRKADPAARKTMIGDALADAVPVEGLAQHLFVAAGVQVAAAAAAAELEASAIVPVATGRCPVCGGRPAASVVVGFHGAEGARYAACSLCATLWNEVRVKCLGCGSTKGIGYREIEGEADSTIKAEACDACHGWLKILYQNRNPSLEAVADDVASLGLDLLMRTGGHRRIGLNPVLLGY